MADYAGAAKPSDLRYAPGGMFYPYIRTRTFTIRHTINNESAKNANN